MISAWLRLVLEQTAAELIDLLLAELGLLGLAAWDALSDDARLFAGRWSHDLGGAGHDGASAARC